MPNEPADMMDAVTTSMRERTGRTLSEWVALVESESGIDPLDQKAVRTWLRDVHDVKQNSQWAIAFEVAGRAGWVMPTVEDQVEQLYAGSKAVLRPLHDRVVAIALGCGDDAEAQSRGSYVPIVRHRQFLAVAPGPRGTLRVGLRYRDDVPDDERLEPAKGFAQATHWVHLAPDADATSLEPLIRAAYEQN